MPAPGTVVNREDAHPSPGTDQELGSRGAPSKRHSSAPAKIYSPLQRIPPPTPINTPAICQLLCGCLGQMVPTSKHPLCHLHDSYPIAASDAELTWHSSVFNISLSLPHQRLYRAPQVLWALPVHFWGDWLAPLHVLQIANRHSGMLRKQAFK
jgi:hypothetical protein